MTETLEEEKFKLIAAATLLIRELESHKKLSIDERKILAELGTKISETKDEDEELSEIKRQLDLIKDRLLTWEVDGPEPEEAKQYLKEARRLAERLESLNPSELLQEANDVVRTAANRTLELFKRMLVENTQNMEHQDLSFCSSEDDETDEDSIGYDPIQRGAEVYIVDLINPQVIPLLKSIVSLMFDSNYVRECSQAYISVRKDALDHCLFVLEVEKSSIEDVLKTEWVTLNSKISRWAKALRIFVRIYLASEKFLCDQIFEQVESASSTCFYESSKASILQLLNFAQDIAAGPRHPEKLLKILDMHQALEDLKPDIESFYADDNVSYTRRVFHDVLDQVGNCAATTFFEFENAVGSNTSNTALPGGGIHHLTRYIMNYITTLVDYNNSLNTLLTDHSERDDQDSPSSLTHTATGLAFVDNSSNEESSSSPMGFHFRSLMSILESNLEEKSRLYKEDALGQLFLMNNTHYIVEKVKASGLRIILGDTWIRDHQWMVQKYAMSFERSSWSSILNLLRDEGLFPMSKGLLKERLQGFYTAVEETYKSQSGWSIPNNELRDDLRISISQKVVPAYRSFVGRFYSIIGKHGKYSADDLLNHLLDLFEGSPRSI